MRALSVIALLGACGGARAVVEPPPKIPRLGISLSVYIGQHVTAGFVDDRRSIEVTAGSIVIPQVSADANFSSLVVEAVDGKPLVVTQCGRERIGHDAKDEVHCAVSGTRGTRIVRVMYALGVVDVTAHHRLELSADGSGKLATDLMLVTPQWNRDADVRIYDGEVDEPQKALPLARATVTLDGSATRLTPPPRMIRGRLRTIFENDPAVVQPDSVSVWAELAIDRLVPGQIIVSAAHDGLVSSDILVTDDQRHAITSRLSLPLWTDPSITVVRSETQVQRTDRATDMRYTVAFTNPMPKAREIWIYHFAADHRVALHGGSPGTPTLANGIMRMQVSVPPKGTVRAEYVLTYLP
ncbi:MAG TPA: hypothetical protein VGM90_03460 [Kofleriaceae bacterium]